MKLKIYVFIVVIVLNKDVLVGIIENMLLYWYIYKDKLFEF